MFLKRQEEFEETRRVGCIQPHFPFLSAVAFSFTCLLRSEARKEGKKEGGCIVNILHLNKGSMMERWAKRRQDGSLGKGEREDKFSQDREG